jgi:hypothetical protein
VAPSIKSIICMLYIDVIDERQSGRSKNRHQPLGLIGPATTAQAAGGRNSAQAAQLNPFFGRSW